MIYQSRKCDMLTHTTALKNTDACSGLHKKQIQIKQEKHFNITYSAISRFAPSTYQFSLS